MFVCKNVTRFKSDGVIRRCHSPVAIFYRNAGSRKLNKTEAVKMKNTARARLTERRSTRLVCDWPEYNYQDRTQKKIVTESMSINSNNS